MFKRINGVSIIHKYNAEGRKIAEFAVIDVENLWLWWLFFAIVAPGIYFMVYAL